MNDMCNVTDFTHADELAENYDLTAASSFPWFN